VRGETKNPQRERERVYVRRNKEPERERECVCVCVCMCVYIHRMRAFVNGSNMVVNVICTTDGLVLYKRKQNNNLFGCCCCGLNTVNSALFVRNALVDVRITFLQSVAVIQCLGSICDMAWIIYYGFGYFSYCVFVFVFVSTLHMNVIYIHI